MPSRLPPKAKPTVNKQSFVTQYGSNSINRNAETYIVIHGFQNTSNEPWIRSMEAALAQQAPGANILALNWPSDLKATEYESAVMRVSPAGEFLAQWIRDKGLDPTRVTLIGHSLGAHVAGATGEAIRNTTGRSIREIVGLDPAGPLFEGGGGLNRSAATKVIAIHTNPAGFGIRRDVGHVDIHLNPDDTYQPGVRFYSVTGNHSYAYIWYDQLLRGSIFSQSTGSDLTLTSLRNLGNGRYNFTTTSGWISDGIGGGGGGNFLVSLPDVNFSFTDSIDSYDQDVLIGRANNFTGSSEDYVSDQSLAFQEIGLQNINPPMMDTEFYSLAKPWLLQENSLFAMGSAIQDNASDLSVWSRMQKSPIALISNPENNSSILQ
jgi:pimeloyl-ACP methyl ester carboxylesterase